MAIIFGTVNNDILNGTNKDDTIYGLAGNDTIHGNQGDDKVVGEQESLTFIRSAITGNVTDPIPVFGADNLYGDQGNDYLYGDVVTILLKGEAGVNSGTLPATLDGIIMTFGDDMLDGGVGNDVLVGDAGEIDLIAIGGGTVSNPVTTLSSNGVVSNSSITSGQDVLWGGNGQDYLYGDIAVIQLIAISGAVNGSATQARGRLIANSFDLAGDELHGGTGDDHLYGDVGSILLLAQGGYALSSGDSVTAFAQVENFDLDYVRMGGDQLYGDEGNDQLAGDVGTLTIQAIAGPNSAGNFSNGQTFNFFYMGNDTLDGGNGDDNLWGDVVHLSFIGQGGAVTGTGINADGFANAGVVMGLDTLMGGNGNDHLFGDAGDITISLTGGTNTGTASDGDASGFIQTVPDFSVILMEADNLQGNAGDDVLYGDAGSMNIVMQGGSNSGSSTLSTAAGAGIYIVTFTMGDDILDGGSGNDRLYGDLGNFSATLTPGTGNGTGAAISATTIHFGDDTLIGAAGHDVLAGDIADPAQLNGFLNAPLLAEDPTANQIIFGNDTFQFSLGGMNGNDVVLDMNGGAVSTATCLVTNVMDTLMFTDVMNVNGGALDFTDVDAQSTFSNNAGHLMMSFAGGSINFVNIAYAGQDSVTDITTNPIIVTA